MPEIRFRNSFPENAPCILALGTFDGVHGGHLSIIDQTVRLARSLGMSAGVFFFRLPPASYFTEAFPGIITTAEERIGIFADTGLDFAVCADFPEYRDMPASAFLENELYGRYGCRGAVCGFNYTFGAGGKGTPDDLSAYFGENFICVPPFTSGGENVSSSAVRRLIAEGDVSAAARLCGRNYSILSTVVSGRRDGRKLGFPTINQYPPDNKVLPACGVYASSAQLPDGRVFRAVTDVGRAPSLVNDRDIIFETHLLGFSGDLYGQDVRLTLLCRIRGEEKFSSLKELTERIKLDIKYTESYFSNNEQAPLD